MKIDNKKWKVRFSNKTSFILIIGASQNFLSALLNASIQTGAHVCAEGLSKHVKLSAGHKFDMLESQGKNMDGPGHSLLERHISGAGAHWTGFQLGDPGIVLSF